MHCLADITPPIKLKHLCQILCRDNFYFEKINPRLKLLTGHHICDYLMKKRMMALQQMIDKKYIIVYLDDFVQFLPWTNFVRGRFSRLGQNL